MFSLLFESMSYNLHFHFILLLFVFRMPICPITILLHFSSVFYSRFIEQLSEILCGTLILKFRSNLAQTILIYIFLNSFNIIFILT